MKTSIINGSEVSRLSVAIQERLPGLLSAFEVVVWMTDDWPLYESRLKGELHDKVIGHYLNIKHYQ